MTQIEELTKCIKKLSPDAVTAMLDATHALFASDEAGTVPGCPHCGFAMAIRYGHKCGKQRTALFLQKVR